MPISATPVPHVNTIGAIGCYISCLGMLTGHTPAEVDTTLSNANVLSSSGDINSAWDAATSEGLSGALDPVEYSQEALEQMMNSSDRRLILAEVEHNGNSHFVVITGEVYDPVTKMCRFTISDPGSANNTYLDQYTEGVDTIRGFLP